VCAQEKESELIKLKQQRIPQSVKILLSVEWQSDVWYLVQEVQEDPSAAITWWCDEQTLQSWMKAGANVQEPTPPTLQVRIERSCCVIRSYCVTECA
jgi:hypothetical protein